MPEDLAVTPETAWRKSSHSQGSSGDCVEIAELTNSVIAVRDSKLVQAPLLTLARAAFADLITIVRLRTPGSGAARTSSERVSRGPGKGHRGSESPDPGR
ncbi:DUF397 domain-containing protein [Actinomadura harenae]|uniref:DUF397 domain-containing protein n=1 Tax=Actinomadura harenae TaxID=2483351 RepID=A0A3M2MCR6_9ACTN|nr:DUF397 domain-containing protein [Actinomadura harenae]RMI47256.1 DUF397 domain-containing protein [Actinomadura harenae]